MPWECLLAGKNKTENETNPECKHWLTGTSPEIEGKWKQSSFPHGGGGWVHESDWAGRREHHLGEHWRSQLFRLLSVHKLVSRHTESDWEVQTHSAQPCLLYFKATACICVKASENWTEKPRIDKLRQKTEELRPVVSSKCWNFFFQVVHCGTEAIKISLKRHYTLWGRTRIPGEHRSCISELQARALQN